jgi:hypothetical protein
MQRIDITTDLRSPVSAVYDHLSEHENLGPLFGARIRRVRDGHASRNGVGSVRALRLGLLPEFEETVTEAVPDSVIEYRITKGSPLRDHVGRMVFTPHGTGTRLHYVIEFGAVVPGFDRVAARLVERSVRRGLAQVDDRLAARR